MDVCVTVPKNIWFEWIAEGDSVGEPPTGELWGYSTWGPKPDIAIGERVYVVAHGRLRGYAPLTVLEYEHVSSGQGRCAFGRAGGAVAVTIAEPITGFRGWRYRWWKQEIEFPFPDWKTAGVKMPAKRAT